MLTVLSRLREIIVGQRPPLDCVAPDRAACIPFKVFGLQRSGTNLAQFLIRENFHVISKEVGLEWKHGPIADPDRLFDGKPLRIIVCVRNPYAWMASCFKFFHSYLSALASAGEVPAPDDWVDPTFSAGTNFAAFVTGPHYDWASPTERWNDLIRHWLDHHDRHPGLSSVIRSEDMQGLHEQERVLERIGRDLSLARLKPRFRTSSRVMDVNSLELLPKMHFEYYRHRRYLAEYNEDMLAHINARLDWSLMNRLHYERVDTPENGRAPSP